MLLKLAFSYDPSDLFRVTAVVTDGRSHLTEPVVAQYKNEGIFYSLLLEADVDSVTQARIVRAITAAATAPSAAACCEEVEFTPAQLTMLRLGSVLSQSFSGATRFLH
jgi:hypothetical protein